METIQYLESETVPESLGTMNSISDHTINNAENFVLNVSLERLKKMQDEVSKLAKEVKSVIHGPYMKLIVQTSNKLLKT